MQIGVDISSLPTFTEVVGFRGLELHEVGWHFHGLRTLPWSERLGFGCHTATCCRTASSEGATAHNQQIQLNFRALPICASVCSESPQTGSPDDRPPTANKGALAHTPSNTFTSKRTRSRPVVPLSPPIPRAPNSQRIAVWLESLAHPLG